jgi:hypothetical protein
MLVAVVPDVENVPAGVNVHVGIVENRVVGVVVIVQVVGLLWKPAPEIAMLVPPEVGPELGESWIVGRTVNVGARRAGGESPATFPVTVRVYVYGDAGLNIAAGATTNDADSWPVEPVTVHERDEMILGVAKARGADVIVHDVSVVANPVPVTVTVVPGVVPSAGEPLIGVTVTWASTVNVVVATSPELPVIVSVYVTPAGTVPETVKKLPVRAPAAIAHTYEASRPVGVETKDAQGPVSDVENQLGPVLVRVIVSPA